MTTDLPVVSIGLPVYNGQRWIKTSLDALLGQSYQNLEVIICDNASTDATSAICAEYAARDPRVRYFLNERNVGTRGPMGNFCRVLLHASGDYFMWASADDWRSRRVVEDCVRALLRNPSAVLAHGPVQISFDTRTGTAELRNDMDLSSASAVDRIRIFTSMMQHNAMIYGLFRTEALRRTTYGDHYGHDYLVCLQACMLGRVEYVSTPLIRYRQRGESLDAVMYPRQSLTLRDLVMHRGVRRYKCWLTLVLGCWYLLNLRGPRPAERMAGAAVYASTFLARYRRRMGTEILFILFMPLAWLTAPLQPVGVRIKALLKRRGLLAS